MDVTDIYATEKKVKTDKNKDVPDRLAWARPLEFILSCLNYAVGLGNVWRFPYLVYRNGGGAFLIPYILMMVAMGLPIFFLEFVVGQYSRIGPTTAFKRMAPIFHGLGYCTLVVITMFTIYYHVIIAWTLFYTQASFDSELGWGSCEHDFNTDFCFSQTANKVCQESVNLTNPSTFSTYFNRTCQSVEDLCERNDMTLLNQVSCLDGNGTVVELRHLLKRVLAAEQYYNDYAMGIRGATWENWGILRWEMVVCLFIAWVIAYMCVVKGIATIGKVVYFTSVFPYVVLTALLIRGATLPGAYEGIMFYITPQWDQLLSARVWGDAASQVFYALGIGCGSLVTLASYNDYNNNCHRDALLIGTVITLTSIFAGFAVFSILGFMAHELGVPVNEVVQDGPGLAFIAYPEAVLQMPLPQLWAVLFFLMLFILGLGTQFAGIEAINTAILDHWPWLRKYNYLVTAGICFSCFIMALPMCFQGGVYLFTLMDWNCASYAILIIGLLELVLVGYVYGASKFVENVREMGIALPKWGANFWWFMWICVAPITLAGVLVFTFYDFTDAYYNDYDFPPWVDALGYMISMASICPIVFFAIYQLIRRKGSVRDLFKPSKKWGPQKPKMLSRMPTDLSIYNNVAFEPEEFDDRKFSVIAGFNRPEKISSQL